MKKAEESLVRAELLAFLRSENAHMDFREAVEEFPIELINEKTSLIPYSPWHIIEHMRMAQHDMVEFIRNPDHISPEWPSGFFPRSDAIADSRLWHGSIKHFLSNLGELQAMVTDPASDLFGPIPHAPGYTLFRQILVAADHNAYHVGELALFRQELGAWPKDRPYLTGTGRADVLRVD